MKTSKNIFSRKAFAFLGAAAVLLSAVFMASCKPIGGGGSGEVTYKVGDIVLSDKSVVARNSYKKIDTANPPVGVVCCAGKAPKMIALHTSSSLFWAKDGTFGKTTKFEDIICTPSEKGAGAAVIATFEGDTDGSDNWAYIKFKDAEGTAEALVATNYPALNWVNTYNTTYNTVLGGKTFAWYLPSIAEMCEVYINHPTINASFAKIRKLNIACADEKLTDGLYWSSSQSSEYAGAVWCVHFTDGKMSYDPKGVDRRGCCLAKL